MYPYLLVGLLNIKKSIEEKLDKRVVANHILNIINSRAMLCIAVLFSAVQWSAVQFRAVQRSSEKFRELESKLFQRLFPITDIATYRLNQSRGQII